MPPARARLQLCVGILFATSLWSCVSIERAPLTWLTISLPGTVLILQSEVEVEELRFLGEATGGWVVLTTGTKDGAISARVLRWRLEGEVLVVGHGNEFTRLRLLRSEPRRVFARRASGQDVQYRMLKS